MPFILCPSIEIQVIPAASQHLCRKVLINISHIGRGGYNDWKVPSIDELRTLIQNCPATETGGECGVTDTCLSFRLCSLNACTGCEFDNYGKGKYSKLGDIEQFWSSSVQPKKSRHVTVFFSTGLAN